jgi:hypothetical protein
MTSDGNPAAGGPRRDAVSDALVELRDDYAARPDEPVDHYWLRVGLVLGLRRPGRAQLLLERLEGGGAASAPTPAATDDPGAQHTVEPDADEIPVRSLLLVRAATLPLTEPPETAFGWALRLAQSDITLMGRILDGLIDAGAPRDLVRGFGLAWTAGVKVSNSELNGLFGRFTDLELTIASVLAGHDIREEAAASKPSISAVVQSWFMPKSGPGADEAGRVLERLGGPAQRGLIAVWNTWAAVRYRSLMPAPLFEQLTQAWVTVVGRLPEA